MKLTKTTKILLGFLSLWPIAYFFIFIFTIFSMFFTSTHVFLNSEANFLPVLFMLHFFTIIYSFGLVIFYICYIFKTDKVPKDKKTLWTVIIFLGNMVAIPIFWFSYIWKEPKSVSNP